MIELQNVFMAYGEKQVLDGFSLSLPGRGMFAVLGPSGRGKTTLLRLIAGLETPQGGRVAVPGHLRIAFCFQEDRLLPWYTVRENIALVLPDAIRRDKEKAARIADNWLNRVGLPGEGAAYPDQLSGGMKRRAALARALAFDAPVLLMDEPFRALDEASHAQMLHLVRSLAQGRTLILVTHDIGDSSGMEVIHL